MNRLVERKDIIVGFPNPPWDNFPGEVRAFLPDFIANMGGIPQVATVIPQNYGLRMNPDLDYRRVNIEVVTTNEEVYRASDLVISLKFPDFRQLSRMPVSSLLVSMIHFPTKPDRVDFLNQQQISGVSLDSVADANGKRVVQDMEGAAWNALNVAFGYLEQTGSPLLKKKSLNALILGHGQMGIPAQDATLHWGGIKTETPLPPVEATWVGRAVTEQRRTQFLDLLENADILIDASARPGTNLLTPVIYNEELSRFPEDGIIIDLSADPYSKFMVKAVEGIPHGTLSRYIFEPKSPLYDQYVPDDIPHSQKRLTFSCEAWPGIHPEQSIRHYQEQLRPLMVALFSLGVNVSQIYERIASDSAHPLVRALYRGSLKSVAPILVATG